MTSTACRFRRRPCVVADHVNTHQQPVSGPLRRTTARSSARPRPRSGASRPPPPTPPGFPLINRVGDDGSRRSRFRRRTRGRVAKRRPSPPPSANADYYGRFRYRPWSMRPARGVRPGLDGAPRLTFLSPWVVAQSAACITRSSSTLPPPGLCTVKQSQASPGERLGVSGRSPMTSIPTPYPASPTLEASLSYWNSGKSARWRRKPQRCAASRPTLSHPRAAGRCARKPSPAFFDKLIEDPVGLAEIARAGDRLDNDVLGAPRRRQPPHSPRALGSGAVGGRSRAGASSPRVPGRASRRAEGLGA